MALTQPIDEYFASLAAATTGPTKVPALNGAGDAVVDAAEFLFQVGNQTAVAGSKMKIERLIEDSDDWPMENEGSIWANKTYTFAGISKTFDASYSDGVDVPATALFAFANNDGATGDVVAILGDAVARSADGTVFGANFIARSAAGINAKVVGAELDIVPASGTTPLTGSGGLYINIFNCAITGSAIQLGTVGGGTFANGITLAGIATTGSGMAPGAAATMDSMFNSGSGVFTTAAGIFSNQHKLLFKGTASTHAHTTTDGSNNSLWQLAGNLFVVRDSGSTNRVTLSAFGVINAPNGGALQISSTQVVGARKTGWAVATGTATRTTYDTTTVTLPQLAERVKALIDDLHGTAGHGLIGT